jgi:hypothetical protein
LLATCISSSTPLSFSSLSGGFTYHRELFLSCVSALRAGSAVAAAAAAAAAASATLASDDVGEQVLRLQATVAPLCAEADGDGAAGGYSYPPDGVTGGYNYPRPAAGAVDVEKALLHPLIRTELARTLGMQTPRSLAS